VTDPNSRLGLLVAGYEKALQDLLTQIITHWQARQTPCCSPNRCCAAPREQLSCCMTSLRPSATQMSQAELGYSTTGV